ncbi:MULTISPECIES: hypothetical protein, partial [unclassified Sphingomonas]|uniref:hypothetical protein n=1 Tax=unclassified Sphingomonas TaxID=196159 RepID=UPI0022697E6E
PVFAIVGARRLAPKPPLVQLAVDKTSAADPLIIGSKRCRDKLVGSGFMSAPVRLVAERLLGLIA